MTKTHTKKGPSAGLVIGAVAGLGLALFGGMAYLEHKSKQNKEKKAE